MAKKAVASLQTGSKRLTKAIDFKITQKFGSQLGDIIKKL